MNRYVFWLVVLLVGCTTLQQEEKTTMFGENANEGMTGAVPKVTTGWSASGKLRMGNANDNVGLQQVFEEPGLYTVEFGVSARSNGVGDALFTEAIIEWSVAGNTITRRVTVGMGTAISATAEGVRVFVQDKSIQGVLPTFEYTVNITVSKGVRATTNVPPVWVDPSTGAAISILDAGSAVIALPLNLGCNAVMVTVGPSVFGGGPIFDEQCFFDMFCGVKVMMRTDPRVGWVPLVPGTETIKVWNNSGRTLVVQVFFGIQG